MIVNRMTQALKRQDWAVVGIEFVLVVVGVLLAFQINEYSNGRAASNEREAATERLLAEAEESVAYLRQQVSMQQSLVDELNFALGRLQQGQWRPSEEPRMTDVLSGVTRGLPMSPPSSVYEDLVASGGFGRIGDAEMRSAMAKYRATLDFARQVREKLSKDMDRLEDHAAFHYAFSLQGEQRARLEVDFAALREDRLLQEKLAILADKQRIFLLLRKNAFNDATRMCVEVGRFVGRRCNLNLPPPASN